MRHAVSRIGGSGESQDRDDGGRLESAIGHLVEREQCRPLCAERGTCQSRRRRFRIGDLDERVGHRVLADAIERQGRGREQGRHRASVADTAKRLGGAASDGWQSRGHCLEQLRQSTPCRAIARPSGMRPCAHLDRRRPVPDESPRVRRPTQSSSASRSRCAAERRIARRRPRGRAVARPGLRPWRVAQSRAAARPGAHRRAAR